MTTFPKTGGSLAQQGESRFTPKTLFCGEILLYWPYSNARKARYTMIIADLGTIAGRRYPARRRTQNLVGGASPIQARHFCMGLVTLDPNGGQAPWHKQDQEEVYFVIEGRGEFCLGDERRELATGQAAYIPSGVYHQLTNLGDTPLRMVYCYGPAGDVAHWHQELSGTLPRAGIEAPPLPPGSQPQQAAPPAHSSPEIK